jgi:hypothetical protein
MTYTYNKKATPLDSYLENSCNDTTLVTYIIHIVLTKLMVIKFLKCAHTL